MDAPKFSRRCFRFTSPNPGVAYVIVGRDGIGWKMDEIGHEHNEWPHGDTYQDTLDELMPFLATYTDHRAATTGHLRSGWLCRLSSHCSH